MKKRPNIVILNPDQMRADSMAHLGNPAAVTPHLDAMAKDGMSFRYAFCQNPVCTPSRCSFMSGWYPHVSGHRTMNHMMHDHEPVLLKYLKDAGYRVWMNQRNDLLPAQYKAYYKAYCTDYFVPACQPEKLPEDGWRGDPEGDNYYSFFRGKVPEIRDIDQMWTQGAVDFIKNYKDESPFCIFLPWLNPHPVYQVSDPWYSMIDRHKLPPRIKISDHYQERPKMEGALHRLLQMDGWTEERYDELRAVYLGMCARVDAMAGQVLEALKENGYYDQTAVFFFSDHGDYTGDYGLVEKVQNCFEDCLTNVPFIVKLPKSMQGRHGISEAMIELIDFYATAEKLAGYRPQHTHFGHSLVDYLAGKETPLRDTVFCEGGFCRGEEHCKEMGGADHPVPGNLYYPRQSLQASDEMYNGKAIMCRTHRYKYIMRLYEPDQLYDLEKDPKEPKNFIQCPEYGSVAAEMKERILKHYMETCDVVPFIKDARM